ncbi:SET domain-containing protein [Parashewanella curva]|uniref:SET domain-containing protein n=1 Tax=Parashewanella curva TaxID=2338552 RepID=A0A3L8PSC7_9GAMM|nr:SET domain-containing protein [Parashewanella curva]RLV57709.1 SET domain-containing protein [Parashewanella curva]
MFNVAVCIKPSAIHGIGLFTKQMIKKGQVIYTETPELDLHLSKEQFAELDEKEQAFIEHFGFFNETENHWHLSHDNIRFCNHATQSNITWKDNAYLVALRDITKGEE